jgi:hypothetical protein
MSAPARRTRCVDLLASSRGTASVEIAVALPVLVVALAAAFYFYDVSLRHHTALQRARACAWDFARQSCDPQRTLLCDDVLVSRGEASTGASVGVLDRLSKLPLLGDALDGLLGETATAQAVANFPVFLDASAEPTRRDLSRTLVCAPSAESLGARMKGALCDLAKDALQRELYGCD